MSLAAAPQDEPNLQACLTESSGMLGVLQCHDDDLGHQRAALVPVMTFSAEKIAAAVGETSLSWPAIDAALLDQLPRGQKVAAAEVLFKKIEDVQIAEWSGRFGGAG